MKPKTKQLLAEIEQDFVQYLRDGFHFESFVDDVDYNLNIQNLDRLLRISFLVSTDVKQYVRTLPSKLRRLKTSTVKQRTKQKGNIEGRINWNQTYKERYQSNPRDRSQFVVEQRERNYDIPENIVLKQFLQTLLDIYEENQQLIHSQSNELFQDWKDDHQLHRNLRRSLLKNVHLQQISLEKQTISDRDLQRVKKSRKSFYKTAGRLLERYQRLMNYNLNKSDARRILSQTLIRPQREEVIFELYWTIKLIRTLQDDLPERFSLNFELLEPSQNLVAVIEDGFTAYKIYHDSVGNFTFHEELSSKEKAMIKDQSGYLARSVEVRDEFAKRKQEIFGKGTQDYLWGGRPDILIEKHSDDTPVPEQVFIGEVKDTRRESYAQQGLRELMEYMAFVKEKLNQTQATNDDSSYFVDEKHEIFSSERLTGCLFTDGIASESMSTSINLIPFNENRNDNLKQLVQNLEHKN